MMGGIDSRRARSAPGALLAAAAAALLVSIGAAPARAGVSVQIHPIPTADSGLDHIVAGPDGALYATEGNAFQIARVTTAGQISQFPVPESQASADVGNSQEGPDEIVSSGGALWFVSDVQGRVFRMTTAGSLAEADDGVDPETGDEFDAQDGLAPSDAGGVWTQPRDENELRLYGPDGAQTNFPRGASNHALHPMTLGPDGTMWYGFQNPDGQYLDNSNDAGAQVNLPINNLDFTYEVSSLAFSSTGRLWFTEEQPGDAPFPASGGAIGSLAPGSSSPRAASTEGLGKDLVPHSLVAGPGGVMYFATTTGLGEISPAGTVTLASIAPYHPTDLAIGSDGNLWFIDQSANAVGRVTLASAFPTPAARPARAPAAALSVPRQKLSTVRRSGRLRATCALAGAGTCALAATVPAATARHLKLRPARHATTYTLGTASRTLKHRGETTLTLTLSKPVRAALKRTRKVTVSIRVTSTAKGRRARSFTRTLTLF